MTFDTVEQSVQDATPAELYDFVYPTVTYRRTSYERDVVFGGNTYTAVAGGRDNIKLVDIANDQVALQVDVIASDPVVQTWCNGVPPKSLLVTVTRYYPSFGVSLEMWSGTAQACEFKRDDKGIMASFRVPSDMDDALKGDCPSVTLSRYCPHFLFDEMCTLSPAGSAFSSPFSVTRTINNISADGKTFILNSPVPNPTTDDNGNPVGWSVMGAIQHAASQEQRTVILELADQVTLTVLTQFPNGAVHVGDSVTVLAGCARTMRMCHAKFNNGINHGGDPELPPTNVFFVGLVNARY